MSHNFRIIGNIPSDIVATDKNEKTGMNIDKDEF